MSCLPGKVIEFRSFCSRQPFRPFMAVKRSMIQLMKLAAGAMLLGVAMLTLAEELPRRSASAGPDVRNLIFKDVQGAEHQPLAAAGQKATVLFFVLCGIVESRGKRAFTPPTQFGVSFDDEAVKFKEFLLLGVGCGF